MQTVDEQPETIHLYIVREKEPKPSLFPIFLSVVALSLLIVICVLFPYQQPVTRITIRVPAVLLPLKTFTAQVAIVPTGVKVYPATYAHGVLTITNGSVIAQILPKGLIVAANNGIEAATDSAVYVPAGSADGYGMSTVSAHLLTSGINVSTLAINQVIGTSLYVRNLSPFTGGKPAYTVKVVTPQDRQTALIGARGMLALQINGLHYPCKEVYLSEPKQITMTWRCQFATYHVPSYMRVLGAKLAGGSILVMVEFIPRPRRFWAK